MSQASGVTVRQCEFCLGWWCVTCEGASCPGCEVKQ